MTGLLIAQSAHQVFVSLLKWSHPHSSHADMQDSMFGGKAALNPGQISELWRDFHCIAIVDQDREPGLTL
jgi:hypothetical protein